MKTLAERLVAVQRKGNLTLADLHRWLGRPYHTVRSWTVGFCQPVDGARPHVEKRLAGLEQKIAKREGLPVPRHLGVKDHAAYFKKLVKNGDDGRVSKSNPSRRRAEVRLRPPRQEA